MKTLKIIMLLMYLFFSSTPLFAANNINVVINRRLVCYTEETGYPFMNADNTIMVPLRTTIEASGNVVGYDNEKSTAIIITEHSRIEVLIGTDIIYKNNIKIQSNTNAIMKNGITYMPIETVLELVGFTLEWDSNTNIVNAYLFKYDSDSYVPYSTSSLKTLLEMILKGNVVYINGGYYATPKYLEFYSNSQLYYSGDDLNIALYPQRSRYELSELEIVH